MYTKIVKIKILGKLLEGTGFIAPTKLVGNTVKKRNLEPGQVIGIGAAHLREKELNSKFQPAFRMIAPLTSIE